MKLNGAQVRDYLRRPDPNRAGLLIHGADAVRVAEARRTVLPALLGPDAEEEMRLSRLAADELRRDPAALQDAMQSAGFFPGPRAVWVEGATDGLADVLAAALDSHRPGDGAVIATAGQLPAKSKLRKLFEGHRSAASIALYDDPPGRPEVDEVLKGAGIAADRDAVAALLALAADGGPAGLRQAVEKLALYRHGEDGEASASDVAAIAPAPAEPETDAILAAVTDGDGAALARLLRRLPARSGGPTGLMIAALRHFRTLHAVAVSGAGALRPPLFGPRKVAAERAARQWGARRLEEALSILLETDLALRSAGARAPAMPVAERTLVRLAALARR